MLSTSSAPTAPAPLQGQKLVQAILLTFNKYATCDFSITPPALGVNSLITYPNNSTTGQTIMKKSSYSLTQTNAKIILRANGPDSFTNTTCSTHIPCFIKKHPLAPTTVVLIKSTFSAEQKPIISGPSRTNTHFSANPSTSSQPHALLQLFATPILPNPSFNPAAVYYFHKVSGHAAAIAHPLTLPAWAAGVTFG